MSVMAMASDILFHCGIIAFHSTFPGVLKRNVNEFSHRSSPVGAIRSAIKTSTPDTDDAKCREISSRAAGSSTGLSQIRNA